MDEQDDAPSRFESAPGRTKRHLPFGYGRFSNLIFLKYMHDWGDLGEKFETVSSQRNQKKTLIQNVKNY